MCLREAISGMDTAGKGIVPGYDEPGHRSFPLIWSPSGEAGARGIELLLTDSYGRLSCPCGVAFGGAFIPTAAVKTQGTRAYIKGGILVTIGVAWESGGHKRPNLHRVFAQTLRSHWGINVPTLPTLPGAERRRTVSAT